MDDTKDQSESSPSKNEGNQDCGAIFENAVKGDVTPWEASNNIDYDKLVREFGCHRITDSLIERIEKLTGKRAHRFLRRGIFFTHRDLELVLDCYEKKIPFYLYTGRGPSSDSMHLGHLVPFLFTKYLQEAFDVPLVIQMTDDEKFLFRDIDYDTVRAMTLENVRDIIAIGFNPDKTFIFSNYDYVGTMYPNICKIQRCITFNQVRGTFGFKPDHNIGKIAFPAIQAAPSFSSSFPHMFGEHSDLMCLIPQAIDQDPYFRITRDVASQLKFKKPAQIHSVFFPALGGPNSKMSASIPNSGIFLTDTPTEIRKKINKFAFSGGGKTLEEHRKYGANIDIDVPYQWLRFFLNNDKELEKIGTAYSKGEILSSDVKTILIDIITEIVTRHQTARRRISDEDVRWFMSVRKMDVPHIPNSVTVNAQKQSLGEKDKGGARAKRKAEKLAITHK